MFGKGQLFDLPFRDSEGNIQLLMPADYIQCAVTEYCSWFYTQGVHRDTFGNEFREKLCPTSNSSGNYAVDEIEFVHKLYFVVVSPSSTCIPVGYNMDTFGNKDIRYIVSFICEWYLHNSIPCFA